MHIFFLCVQCTLRMSTTRHAVQYRLDGRVLRGAVQRICGWAVWLGDVAARRRGGETTTFLSYTLDLP